MLTIEFQSLSGQFHATPWNHHVNEGVVEWPPSPWRIVRALLATWHLKAREEISAEVMSSLVNALSSELPHYSLPPMVEAHTRHYMPLRDHGKSSKIFQSFARLESEPIVMNWPTLTLSNEELDVLALLLNRLGFLGRAESWIEARVIDQEDFRGNCAPHEQNSKSTKGLEVVRVLAPRPSDEFIKWRDSVLPEMERRELEVRNARAIERGKEPKTKLTKSQRTGVYERIPETLVGALQCDTSELKALGWSQPPGSQWVDYLRPVQRSSVLVQAYKRPDTLPTVARFAVASAVPPRLTDALFEAEKLHRSLVKWSDGAPVFTGCDEQRRPLEGHQHAYILPESYGTRGQITHFTVYAEMGFDANARRALEGVRRLWGRKGHDLQLVLVGIGTPSDFAGWNTRAGACPILLESRVWRSRTPFVATRYIRRSRNGKPQRDENGLIVGSPEHDLRRLLALQDLTPSIIEEIDSTNLGKNTRWLEFKTNRIKKGGRRPPNSGTGYQITFDEPVQGPIAIGYGAHLGLGQFLPVKEGTELAQRV